MHERGSEPPAGAPADGGPAEPFRVLVVEDERLVAEELAERLSAQGYAVVGIAATAEDAVAKAVATRPDLVLMDIRLKGAVDGIAAAAEIRTRCHASIVFLSSHSDDATVDRAMRLGPSGYMLKPVREHDLRITLPLVLQKHALERRLRESEQHYQETLGGLHEAVIATDAMGRVGYMNPSAERLTGWSSDEARAQSAATVVRLVNGITKAPVDHPVRRALAEATDAPVPPGTVLVGRDGAEIAVEDGASTLLGTNGEVVGAVLALRDVRDRLAAERALRDAEAGLRDAQKLEAIGRLAGGVAHDINNMMTVVSGYADLILREAAMTDGTRALVENIATAAARSTDMTRQLLAFGRRQILKPVVVDLNAIVAGMTPVLRRLVGEDVVLSTVLEPALPCILADAGQMEQVLLNLAANARDAMTHGGTLRITTSNVVVARDDGATSGLDVRHHVRLAVADDGVGMDEDTRRQIFEPFFTTKASGQGTGLGLATVYGIVKQSGGSIDVSSEPGRGTVFTIGMPVAGANEVERGAATPLPRGHETVLLVEDERAVRDVARRFLEVQGYTVLPAADGDAAMRLAAHHLADIDVLVTDAVVPGLSGRQIAERLQAQRPGLAVVYMSGYTEDRVLQQVVTETGVPFVPKPFNATQLVQAVRQALDSRQGR